MIRILAMAIGLVSILAGTYVLYEGGISRTPPLHLNVACTVLGLGLIAVGALFALLPRWLGRPPRAQAQ